MHAYTLLKPILNKTCFRSPVASCWIVFRLCYYRCCVCCERCCVYFSLLCLHTCINSAVSHQQQVTALVQGICVQAASTAHPGTVWKMSTDLCQSFSSLSFSPGTGKPQESSMAAAEPSSAHLMLTKSLSVRRKFISKMCQSPFLVPELCTAARAEWKPWRLQSSVLMYECCLGLKNHRGLHLARVETPDGDHMALRRRILPYIQCTACGNEWLHRIRLSGVKAVKSASNYFVSCQTAFFTSISPASQIMISISKQCQYIYNNKMSIHCFLIYLKNYLLIGLSTLVAWKNTATPMVRKHTNFSNLVVV